MLAPFRAQWSRVACGRGPAPRHRCAVDRWDPPRSKPRLQPWRKHRRSVSRRPSLHHDLGTWCVAQGGSSRVVQVPAMSRRQSLDLGRSGQGLRLDRCGTRHRRATSGHSDPLTRWAVDADVLARGVFECFARPPDPRGARRGAKLHRHVASRDPVAVSHETSSRIRLLSRGTVLLLVPCFLGLLATGAAGAPVRRRRRDEADTDVRAQDGSAVSAAPLAGTEPRCAGTHRPAPLPARYPATRRSRPARGRADPAQLLCIMSF